MDKENSKKKNNGSDESKEDYRPTKDVIKNLVSNKRYVPLTAKSTRETFPVSQFKISLPKPKPNPDCNFCCIYFDGTKWEKNKRSKQKTDSNKRSSTTSQPNSMEKEKEETLADDKKCMLALSPKPSRFKLQLNSKKSKRAIVSEYLKRKPVLKNKEIQTEHLELVKFKSSSRIAINDSNSALVRRISNTKSELLKKLELHKKELEQKYSAVKVQDLIQRLQNHPNINENVLHLLKNQKFPQSRKFNKKKPDHRFHLSKQTLPIIEINSIEASSPEEESKKDAQTEISRPRIPHRRISERELVAIFENSRQFKPSVSFEKHEYKPSRPQIPRKPLTHQPLKFDQPGDTTPKVRPTIPRRKITEPPPVSSRQIIYLNKDENIIEIKNESTHAFTSPSLDSPEASKSSIMKSLTSKLTGNRDLSELFLKLITDKKIPEAKTSVILEEPSQECSNTSTKSSKKSNNTCLKVSSHEIIGNQPMECFYAVPDEKKLKTLFTMSNSYSQKQSCNSTEPQSQYSMQDEINMPTIEKQIFETMPVKEVKVKKQKYMNEIKKIITENENENKEANKKQENVNIDQICSNIKTMLAKKEISDLTKNLSNLPGSNNIPAPNLEITVNTATEHPLLKTKIKKVFLNKMGTNLFNNAQALHKSVSNLLRAQTCPSMKRISLKDKLQQTKLNENKLEPKISKSTNITKVASKKSKSNLNLNTGIPKLNNLNLNLKNIAESTVATEITSGRSLEKKWTVGSIYNSTLLFTKVNKDYNKDSSFKKRKEYYRKLRTKQKNDESSHIKCQKNGKCKKFSLGSITNAQKFDINTKCPLSKNLYYSRIENLPVRRNFRENINFSCTKKGENFETKKTSKLKNILPSVKNETRIDTIVPVHNFKSESEFGNGVFEENYSYTSVESGIQSCTTSLALNNNSTVELKSRSEVLVSTKAKRNKIPNKAFTVAQCAISNQIELKPNDLLTEIINLNQDSLFTNILSINQNCCYNGTDPVDLSKLLNINPVNYYQDKTSTMSRDVNGKKKNIWGKVVHLFKNKKEKKMKKMKQCY